MDHCENSQKQTPTPVGVGVAYIKPLAVTYSHMA